MTTRPETLREQHRDFVSRTETIREVADSVGEVPLHELRERVCEIYELLVRRLVPHVMAEDRAPLPQVIGGVDRGGGSSDLVTREHLEMARLMDELDALRWELSYPLITSMQEQALRRVLYGLYALLCVHVVGGEERCVCERDVGALEERRVSYE